ALQGVGKVYLCSDFGADQEDDCEALDQGRTGDVEMSTVVLAGTGTSGEIYRSTDGGQSWSLVQQLGSESNVFALVNLGRGVRHAGRGADGRVYRSTEGG